MKENETTETLTEKFVNSQRTIMFTKIFIFAGIIICMLPLLPPIQEIIFSFVDAGTSGVNLKTSGTFSSRLMSLLSLPFLGLLVFIFTLCCLYAKTIASFLNEARSTKFIVILITGVITLTLGFISIFSYHYGWQWINSDTASEMVLGKLLADENSFVSSNWRYSTEIRLIYQTIFTMPLFKIFGSTNNWAMIRALNILFNNMILILSYFYFARQIKIPIKWALISCLFLLLPMSTGFWNIVTFGGYYIFFIAQIFCCLGLYIKLTNTTSLTKKILLPLILFTILSFLLGLQGIRSLFSFYFPLLITCILFYMLMTQKRHFPLLMGCYGFIMCCAGFAGNFLLHFKFSFHSFDSMRMENLSNNFLPKLGQSLVCLPEFFGLTAGNTLLSAHSLLGITAILGTIILFGAVTKLFFPRKTENDISKRPLNRDFIPLFFLVSVIFNIFVFIIVDEQITNRYFIPFMVLYIPLTAILFEYAEAAYGYLKRVAVISGIVLFILGQSYLNMQNLTTRNINSNRKEYIQYLLDNQLNYGFSTFWNANITTELTNGRINLAGIEPTGLEPGKNNFKIQGWLNPVAFYNPAYHTGESFLLLTRSEWELARETGRPFTQLQPEYEDNDFIIKRFPSAQIIHHDVLDN